MRDNAGKNKPLRVCTFVNSCLVRRLQALGRSVALRLGGVSAEDASQEAVLEALIVQSEAASQGAPLDDAALLGRVHDRLTGHSSHPSRLLQFRACQWDGMATAESER